MSKKHRNVAVSSKRKDFPGGQVGVHPEPVRKKMKSHTSDTDENGEFEFMRDFKPAEEGDKEMDDDIEEEQGEDPEDEKLEEAIGDDAYSPTGDAEADGVFVEGSPWTGPPCIDDIASAKIGCPLASSPETPPQEAFMQWMLHPVALNTYHKVHFERKPLLVSRGDANYNAIWVTSQRLRDLLTTNSLKWGIDFTVHKLVESGTPGRYIRKDYGLDKKGEVASGKSVLKLHDAEGCSIRFLSPHLLDEKMQRCTQLFESYFNNFAGNNIYYTPANAAGFMPHWDDVDAWLMQVEGAKEWRLWSPPGGCSLPRHYSIDFNVDELGDADYTFRLEAGDLLYIPRGWIHSGRCEETSSLHMTLSAFYRHTWADLLRSFAMNAIRDMEATDVRLRRGLPRDMYRVLGSAREIDCSPFEHWPVDQDKLEDIGPTAYRALIHSQAEEGPHSYPLPRLHSCPEVSFRAKSANQQRKLTKVKHTGKKGEDDEDEDVDVRALKRRTRMGAHVRGLLLEMLGVVETPMTEEEDHAKGYASIQTLPLDESVDILATGFYNRRLAPDIPARFSVDCPTETVFGTDAQFKPARLQAAQAAADRLEAELCELDEVRLTHPEVAYPMLKPKPAHDASPAPKVDEEDGVQEETFLLLHHATNAHCTDDVGKEDLSYPLELPLRSMCFLKHLQSSWPKWSLVKDIPMLDDADSRKIDLGVKVMEADVKDKIMLASELFSCGILVKRE
eukprot:GHVH01008275.1.p1 GENE.GHVH01008275.1~~GHVH01008275.1.p1  ORF type:complete len:730 (+),score=130.98 GHVH01008275.1:42-2231(+)